MGLRKRLSKALFSKVESQIEERITSGVSALHSSDGWKSGFFVSDTPYGRVRIVLEADENSSQATVYAENAYGNKSREWSIPSGQLEDGIESAAGAVYDVTLGDYK